MNYFQSKIKFKPNIRYRFLCLIVLAMVFTSSFAQYSIKKYSLNSGASKMSGGRFEMYSSIAQVEASEKQMGGNYVLSSGFWQESNDLIFGDDLIFKNGME